MPANPSCRTLPNPTCRTQSDQPPHGLVPAGPSCRTTLDQPLATLSGQLRANQDAATPSPFTDLVSVSTFFISTPSCNPMPQTSARSGPGRCAKCSKTYSDLLDHIHKRHPGQRFHPHEITGTGLELCRCGKVVLNRAGLIKHQVRYGCWGTQASGVFMAGTFGLSADKARKLRICSGSDTTGTQQYFDQPQLPASRTHRTIVETCANCNIINSDPDPIYAFIKISAGTV